jgi:hypothetical protein
MRLRGDDARGSEGVASQPVSSAQERMPRSASDDASFRQMNAVATT